MHCNFHELTVGTVGTLPTVGFASDTVDVGAGTIGTASIVLDKNVDFSINGAEVAVFRLGSSKGAVWLATLRSDVLHGFSFLCAEGSKYFENIVPPTCNCPSISSS